MSLLPAFAALGLGAAALLSTLVPAARLAPLTAVARTLAALAAACLLPSARDPGAWPSVAIAGAGAVLPRPLVLLLGAAGATLLSLGAGASAPTGPPSLAVVALAAAVAAAAVSSSTFARLATGADVAWAAAAGGSVLAVMLATVGGGRVLRWSYVLGSGPSRVDLPGVGLLLGLALLASLAGSLVLAAHLVAGPPGAPGLSRISGQRLLLVAAGLAVLGAWFVVAQGSSRSTEALASGSAPVAGLVAALGLLILVLILLLGEPPAGDASALEAQAEAETRIASALAVLGALAAGIDGWLRMGTYATPLMSGAVAAALLGLAATQATRFGTLRRIAFLAALLALLISRD